MKNVKWFSNFLYATTKKSVNTDIWKDIIDYDNSTSCKIYLKNQRILYVGDLIAREEKGRDSWFVFKNYSCYNLDTGKRFDSDQQEFPTVVALNLSEIERVELFYDIDTKIFD